MKPTVFKKAAVLWQKASSGPTPTYSDFEPEVKDRLLSIFQAGDYYHWIFNLREVRFEFMSDSVQEVLGYTPEEMDVPTLINNIHPDDHQWFLKFEAKVVEFFTALPPEQVPDYKIRFDYRLKKKQGGYVRVLHQVITIDYDGEGGFFRTFGVHTDITHLKPEGKPMLSFIGLNDLPSYIDVQVDVPDNTNTPALETDAFTQLSRREREVLAMLADGRKSDEIAQLLNISSQTVKTHRKHILAKTNAQNTAELIKIAVTRGWI